MNAPGAQGRTPVMRAVGAGNYDVVMELFNMGANLEVIDSQKRNIMHYLPQSLKPEEQTKLMADFLFRKLKDIKTMVNSQSTSGYTPLMLAASRGNITLCKVLVNAEADLELKNEDDESALFMAKNAALGKYLSSCGASGEIQVSVEKRCCILT